MTPPRAADITVSTNPTVVDRPSTLHDVIHVDAPDDSAPLLDRGIHLTPWFVNGRRYLIVIDHTHSIIHREAVTDNGDRNAQVRSLEIMLNALDPLPIYRIK